MRGQIARRYSSNGAVAVVINPRENDWNVEAFERRSAESLESVRQGLVRVGEAFVAGSCAVENFTKELATHWPEGAEL